VAGRDKKDGWNPTAPKNGNYDLGIISKTIIEGQ
jgi:hypothetical protein